MIILTIFVLKFLSDNASTISAKHLFLLFLLALRQLILLLVMANDYLMEHYLLSMKIVEILRVSKYYLITHKRIHVRLLHAERMNGLNLFKSISDGSVYRKSSLIESCFVLTLKYIWAVTVYVRVHANM